MGRVRGMRKATGLLAMTAVTALALSGCAAGGSTGGSGDNAKLSNKPVTLSFDWWGNNGRTKITENVIKAFEKVHPNITIEPQYTDWSGYWDKLATETAANNSPDILQMDEKYIDTYGQRGILLDLNTLKPRLSLKDFATSVRQSGEIDGKQYGVPVGLNSVSIIVNPTLLKRAGVAMPDDKTWTWDDLNKASAAVSAAGGGKFFGLESWGFDSGTQLYWLREHGDALFNKKGEVVVKPETLTSYWQYLVDVSNSGAVAPAAVVSESQATGSTAGSLMATNKAAFGVWTSNQINTLISTSGSPLKLLRLPTTSVAKAGSGFYKSSMYWCASARTKHPAEVALFLDYMTNSRDAANVLLSERGVPANAKVATFVAPKLSEPDKAQFAFLASLKDVVGGPPAITPPGGSALDALMTQYTGLVMFKKATPAQASAGFIKDLKAAIAAA